jgi:hypothetical protein
MWNLRRFLARRRIVVRVRLKGLLSELKPLLDLELKPLLDLLFFFYIGLARDPTEAVLRSAPFRKDSWVVEIQRRRLELLDLLTS